MHPGLKTAKPRVRSRAKMSATSPSTVKAMFTTLQSIATNNAWSLPGCGKGSPNIPAGAVICNDEIQVCQERGEKILIICQGKQIPLAISSGIDSFKLTILVSVGLDGVLHPPVCVYSGKTWQTGPDGRLRGINSDWGFDYTDTGSVKKSSGDGQTFRPGTMAKVAHHWVRTGRKYAPRFLGNDELLIRAMDQAGCHADDVGIKILAEDHQAMFRQPSQTTHYLAVNDARELNRRIRQALDPEVYKQVSSQGGISKGDLMRAVQAAITGACTKSNIMAAARRVGYTYDGTGEILKFGDDEILHAVNLHSDKYAQCERSTLRVGTQLRPREKIETRKFRKDLEAFAASRGYEIPKELTVAHLENLRDIEKAPLGTKRKRELYKHLGQVRFTKGDERGCGLIYPEEEGEFLRKRRKEAAAKSEKQKGSKLAKALRSGEDPLRVAELILAKLGESGKDHLLKTELKAWLKKRGLSAKGSKNDLLARVELYNTNVSI